MFIHLFIYVFIYVICATIYMMHSYSLYWVRFLSNSHYHVIQFTVFYVYLSIRCLIMYLSVSYLSNYAHVLNAPQNASSYSKWWEEGAVRELVINPIFIRIHKLCLRSSFIRVIDNSTCFNWRAVPIVDRTSMVEYVLSVVWKGVLRPRQQCCYMSGRFLGRGQYYIMRIKSLAQGQCIICHVLFCDMRVSILAYHQKIIIPISTRVHQLWALIKSL